MGQALDSITSNATAAAVAGAATAAVADDSLNVRSSVPGKRIRLLQAWAHVQTAGFVSIRSPKMHDQTQGYRFRTLTGGPQPALPWGCATPYFENELLTVTLGEGAVAGDIGHVCQLVWYEDLEGINARLLDAATVKARTVELVTVENTIAAGVAGGFSGAEALNAEFDLLKANNDYALLGYRVGTACAAVAWRGTDTGNLRVIGPGDNAGQHYTSDWFVRLSKMFELPLIPVFNANNRGAINVSVAQNELGVDVEVTSIFARLG